MAHFQKVRDVFAALTRRRADAEPTESKRNDPNNHHCAAGSSQTREPVLFRKHEDAEDDFCGALSEIAAPGPVERLSEAELARHPSLEKSYENSRDDPYGSLSEVAASEPVERLSEAEIARHPSLEQGLRRFSQH